ncbi:MAG: hypothetical protein ACE5FD_01260 [Anaerolineae bacterium]
MTEEITAQEAPEETQAVIKEEDAGGQEPQAQVDAGVIEAELKRARREAAKYRTELRKLQEAEEKRQRAEMSEVDRLKADLEQAQQQAQQAAEQARTQLIRSAVVAEAAKAGFADPADAVQFVDPTGLAVNDDGLVDGAADAITALAEQKPYLLKQQQAASQSSPTNPAREIGSRSKEELRKLVYGDGADDALWEGGVRMPDGGFK